ncbi:Eco57I restriction-modification methylase domain-containing protein [Thermodesulfobacterium thermophilum]|uniref:Eco57I restriction-modification methylase domain-containing protein n=1 Tax=Thermodesulfobacterium thermophilum TaxID=886 RepID=UPI0004206C98|nr:N-6 DNA methylase [Thermodesulfobacterium thermophilum]
MPIHSTDKDIRLAEELAKNFSYEALEDFLFNKNFTIKPEKKFYLGDKTIDDYGIKKLQLLATKEIEQQPLHVYTLELTTNLTERSSKKRQFDIAKKLLDKVNIGLFIFHDDSGNFRFSLVYKEPIGTKARYSYYKRYTFYVSPKLPNKTFILQVGRCDFETFESIKSAFSVEPVTKQFYDELQAWYYYAMDKVWFPEDYKYSDDPEKDREIRTAINLIRLITRLIFIWFLKEKELIPEVLFDKEQLKSIVKDFGKGYNYYNAILQNLFFATLNRPINERGWAFDKGFPANKSNFGVKSLYRYEDKFLIPPDEVMKIFSEIPFINGGLFDCLDKDSVYIDGFSRNPKKQAKIPDYLFFQEEEQTVDLSNYGLGRKKFRGLIEILKSYNFTTDEATPIDQEIALDPELLGKVFENLLASYNPETATTARKATGSYYTPREIVDYMVDESLKAYLKTVLPDIPEESIELLLSYSDEVPNLTEDHRLKIAKAIDNLKIIDPACGSGAFLMGALHKLVHILQKIDPDNRIWYEIQLEKASKEADEIFKIEKDKEKREELLRELNENFDTNINEPDYARKLYLIENCIYGVDIQPIAIQISKLRFFISLILDQKVDKSKPNFGILPLPNLETKFIAANTLIGLEKPSNPLHLIYQHTATLEMDLKLLRHRYFRIKTRREKEELQKKDHELRKQIANILKKHGWSDEVAEKIASFDPFDQNASADWFDPEWMFGVRGGFDIVIGNPPYVSTKGVDKEFKKVLERVYGFSDDLYNHFYFKGIEILRENGILAFISSKTFWTIQTKKNLRKLILDNKLLQLVDTANPFESAMVDTCITIVQKTRAKDYEILFIDARNGLDKKEVYKVKDEAYKNVANNVFFMPTEFNLKIYEKIGKKVKELLDKWWPFISDSKKIYKYKEYLDDYRNSLKPGDITLLGLITEGGQGLATGNNGKYVGVLEGTKWAEKVRKERPEKLWNFIKTQNPKELSNLKSKKDVEDYLNSLSEKEIRKLFDGLKEKYGRDIFGQGWLYRIVSKDEIADVDSLSDDEKLNGIDRDKTYVPYDKGDKDGNRWWAPTPYYIDWNRENVRVLQTDPKARWQGYQFYFREGFCWNNVSTPINEESMFIKCRIKEISVNDVASMSLYTKHLLVSNNKYLVSILNSRFLFNFLKEFINTSVNLQINDIRQLPIIIPTPEQLKEFELIFDRAKRVQEEKFSGKITEKEAEERLEKIQKELDEKVLKLYGLE